jgi:hypothetical protein
MRRSTACLSGVIFVLFAGLAYQQARIHSLQQSLAVDVDELVQFLDSQTLELKAALAESTSNRGAQEIQFTAHDHEGSEPQESLGTLIEPDTVRHVDTLDRIEMLQWHLQSKPSIGWIADVLDAAARDLRENSR